MTTGDDHPLGGADTRALGRAMLELALLHRFGGDAEKARAWLSLIDACGGLSDDQLHAVIDELTTEAH